MSWDSELRICCLRFEMRGRGAEVYMGVVFEDGLMGV